MVASLPTASVDKTRWPMSVSVRGEDAGLAVVATEGPLCR